MKQMMQTVWTDIKQALLILLFIPFALFAGVAPATMLGDTGEGLGWVLCQDDQAVPAQFNANGELEPAEDHAHDPCAWSKVVGKQFAFGPADLDAIKAHGAALQYGTVQAAIFQPRILKRLTLRGPPEFVI
ncbi:MAG: hypothetical protein ACWA40_04060 [Planktomarina sp.]